MRLGPVQLLACALLVGATACSDTGLPRPTSFAALTAPPPDMPLLSEQPWNTLGENSWSYLLRSSSIDAEVVDDRAAPFSPPHVLRIAFTPDMPRDSEPSVHWTSLPPSREVYAEWWIKLSPNWTTSPIGAGKMTFLWAAEGIGQVFTHLGGPAGQHHVQVNTEWAPYGQHFWEPNVAATSITYGRWYHIGWYARWSSREVVNDGILRWWVDGELNGDYANVFFPQCCFQQFEFAPTRQIPPDRIEYMYVDHTLVRAR